MVGSEVVAVSVHARATTERFRAGIRDENRVMVNVG